MNNSIREHLIKLQDRKHADFCSKLMPTVNPDSILGIKTPVLRKLATEISGNTNRINFFRICLTNILKKIIFTHF